METKQHAFKKSINQNRKTNSISKTTYEINENKNTILQNVWNAAKAVLRGKYTI